jgi:hypothetical protein
MADNRETTKHLIQDAKDKCGNFEYEKLFDVEKNENKLKSEILRLKKLNYEKTILNQNLSKIIDDLKQKIESKHSNFRLLFIVVLMVVLLVLTMLIVGVVVFLMKNQENAGEKHEPDNVKLPSIPYNRSVAENIYEDIRPGRNEAGEHSIFFKKNFSTCFKKIKSDDFNQF